MKEKQGRKIFLISAFKGREEFGMWKREKRVLVEERKMWGKGWVLFR